MSAELRRVDGKPVPRFERLLRHPPEKVWRAVTEPAELAHWFPAAVEVDGRTLRFTFPDGPDHDGEVLESDPPRVFAFRWQTDVLRFELLPHDDGCLLVFTHAFDAEPSAGRTAAGWDTCFAALEASLAGGEAVEPTDWLGLLEGYVRRFGLDEGHADGTTVRFVRDLVWQPLGSVWELFTEGSDDLPARASNPHVPPGPVTAREEPRLLEFDSPTGRVRWEFRHDPDRGTTVELTHDVREAGFVPTALAAWHVHLELFFAATFGEIRCPWPEDRVTELTARYGSRASS